MHESDKKTAILVLGMHRSGTSALAGALTACGAHAGESQDMLAANPEINALGYWEHHSLIDINEALLTAAGQYWYSPFALEALAEREPPEHLVSAARHFIDATFRDGMPLLLKDPRLCLTGQWWKNQLEAAGFRVYAIHLLRNPEEIARSLDRRDGLQADHAHALWLAYAYAAEQLCQSCTSINLQYDTLLAQPATAIHAIEHTLSIPLSVSEEQLAQRLQPQLRHHKGGSPSGSLGEISASYYQALSQQEVNMSANPLLSLSHRETGLLQALTDTFHYHNSRFVQAQDIVQQRDQQLTECHDQLQQLSQLYQHAETVVTDRDQQLKDSQQALERIGKLHQHAQEVVVTRDQELEAINDRYNTAQLTILEKDSQLHNQSQTIESLEHEIAVVKKRLGPLARLLFKRAGKAQ